jgi:O-antigen ligase
VTITAIPAVADGHSPESTAPWDLAVVARHLSVAAAALWWAFGLTHATGGRDPRVLTVGIVLAVVALLCVAPWRTLSGRSLALAATVSVAPVLVCLIDPTHWFGASQAATYGYSAALFITVRAYASTSSRRLALLGLVFAAAVAQVGWSMIAWVGGGDPAGLLVGTFYWHDQFAAFLLAPAVIGAGLAAVGTGQLRLAGVLVAVLGSAGVVLSTSRSTMALLVAGWLVAGVLAVLSAAGVRARLMAGVRFGAVAGLAALVTVVLPGPPLFTHRIGALASTAARGATQSLASNSDSRVVFWKQALTVFRHHPLLGAGFGSFGRQSGRLAPNASAHSTLVHSGVLQPLSDGGLLLAFPFLLACALVGLGLLHRLLPYAWRADHGAVTLVAIGALLLAVHSAVDFDWTYPSLMAMSAILAAIALAWSPTEPIVHATGSRTTVSFVACLVLAAAALVLAVPAVHGGWKLNAPATASPSTSLPVSGEPAS